MTRFPVSICAVLTCLSLTCASILAAPPTDPIPVWPGEAPGERGDVGEEQPQASRNDNITRIQNVTQPTLQLYPASQDKNTGATVMICPGGAYQILAMNLEGTEVAEWLNSIGVNAVVLKYRVPRRSGRAKHEAPLQDAQRAMGLIRHHAKDWGLDPNRIGVMGFSAGGHLSAALSTNHERRSYNAIDEADRVSCRPDFTLLVYPAYLTIPELGNAVSPELPVDSHTPPTLIIQTQDDGIPVENSVFYYLALRRAEVPVTLHLYPSGGHGYGLRPSPHEVCTWPARAADWMKHLGVLTPNDN